MPPPTLSRRAVIAGLAALPILPRPALAQALRPADWAQPLLLAGVPNLFVVADGFYRSAQPDAAGFAALAGLGVASVINLRRSLDDAPLAQGSGIRTLHVPIKTRAITAQGEANIVPALRALRDTLARGPVLVHCTHGADRTGMIAALYRMLEQGRSRSAAIAEMEQGGFGFHAIWANIPRYLQSVDLAALRAAVAAG